MIETITKQFVDFTKIEGVHVLPVMLTPQVIVAIYKDSTIKSHHGEEGGHGEDGGHRQPPKEPTPFRADKPWRFTRLAKLIFKSIPRIELSSGLVSTSVDGDMQIYTLPDGGGVVPPHIDENFRVGSSLALYSILIYLNDAFTGGETVFNGSMYAPKIPVGAGLLFRHNILHEGLKVTSGEKHVLKTDLLFSFE